MTKLILASSSPERARILKEFGYQFNIRKPNIQERIDGTMNWEANAIRLAKQKAEAAAQEYPEARVLAADTIVINAYGELLLKPRDKEQAREFLRKRSGSYEKIITGYCLMGGQESRQLGAEESIVYYDCIPLDAQKEILRQNEWQGVSGGLKIEGSIASYIKKIEGDAYNVRGLPIYSLQKFLTAQANPF